MAEDWRDEIRSIRYDMDRAKFQSSMTTRMAIGLLLGLAAVAIFFWINDPNRASFFTKSAATHTDNQFSTSDTAQAPIKPLNVPTTSAPDNLASDIAELKETVDANNYKLAQLETRLVERNAPSLSEIATEVNRLSDSMVAVRNSLNDLDELKRVYTAKVTADTPFEPAAADDSASENALKISEQDTIKNAEFGNLIVRNESDHLAVIYVNDVAHSVPVGEPASITTKPADLKLKLESEGKVYLPSIDEWTLVDGTPQLTMQVSGLEAAE